MSTHRPSGQDNGQSWNHIPLGLSVSLAAQPNTKETSTPPNDTHASMLKIILDPRLSPAMFGKGVDASPSRNDDGVEEFHGTANSAKPELSGKKDNRVDDTVRDEGRSHDEVRRTLSQVVVMAKTEGGNTSK
jgi:hypothetical protein